MAFTRLTKYIWGTVGEDLKSDHQRLSHAAMQVCLIMRGEKMNSEWLVYIKFVGLWIALMLMIGVMLS